MQFQEPDKIRFVEIIFSQKVIEAEIHSFFYLLILFQKKSSIALSLYLLKVFSYFNLKLSEIARRGEEFIVRKK